jgi:hypothetical protein
MVAHRTVGEWSLLFRANLFHYPFFKLAPAPKRKQSVSCKNFIRSHRDILVGMDFFTAKVLTRKAGVAGPHYWGPAL